MSLGRLQCVLVGLLVATNVPLLGQDADSGGSCEGVGNVGLRSVSPAQFRCGCKTTLAKHKVYLLK